MHWGQLSRCPRRAPPPSNPPRRGLRDVIAATRPDLDLRTKALAAVEWIHSIGAGVDGLVYGRPLPRGVLLTKTSKDFGPAIGEWCVTRALAANQNLAALEQAQRENRWDRDREPVMVRGQRALILGTGSVGSPPERIEARPREKPLEPVLTYSTDPRPDQSAQSLEPIIPGDGTEVHSGGVGGVVPRALGGLDQAGHREE